MSFWNSDLINNFEDGELPTVDVNANVTIDDDSVLKLALAIIFSVVIIYGVRAIINQG
ncbi:MAG: hypothetical protein MK172_08705 [Verrucomicrobiales bacterium]|nr:hypothetical protein [Verrucomicrobiales bacterium]